MNELFDTIYIFYFFFIEIPLTLFFFDDLSRAFVIVGVISALVCASYWILRELKSSRPFALAIFIGGMMLTIMCLYVGLNFLDFAVELGKD